MSLADDLSREALPASRGLANPGRDSGESVIAIISRAVRPTVALITIALACCACARSTAALRPRPSTDDERRLLSAALNPLLAAVADPALHRDGCSIGLGILPTPRINAGVGPGSTTPCVTFTLLVTEGALVRLPLPVLRAMLAHELGHLALKHTPGKNSQADEAAADRFAVDLLKRIEPRFPEACVQLVYVFSVLGQPDDLGASWRASHPSPDRRAETTLQGCNL